MCKQLQVAAKRDSEWTGCGGNRKQEASVDSKQEVNAAVALTLGVGQEAVDRREVA